LIWDSRLLSTTYIAINLLVRMFNLTRSYVYFSESARWNQALEGRRIGSNVAGLKPLPRKF